jgi:hypothetical protein
MSRLVEFTTVFFSFLLVVLLFMDLVDLDNKPLQSQSRRGDQRTRRS